MVMRKSRSIVLMAVLVALLAAGCAASVGVAVPAEPDLASSSADSATGDAGPETRAEILALSGLTVEGGGTFDADSVAGQNVLLWFWGPH